MLLSLDSSRKASQQNLGESVLKFLAPALISCQVLALMLWMFLLLMSLLVTKARTHSLFGFVAC